VSGKFSVLGLSMKMVDFQWWVCRDGYRLEQSSENDFAVISQSHRFRSYRPSEIRSLFAIFAEDTPSTPEGMRYFCGRFGMPGGTVHDFAPSSRGPDSMQWGQTSVLLGHQWNLRRAVDLYRGGQTSELLARWNSMGQVALVRTEMQIGPEGRPQMVFAPLDLIQAMWLQLAEAACAGSQLLRCERCSQPFVVGPGTGRRGTSKWCSNACKVAAYQERQGQKEVA
jgi:hypothetical protein